MKTLVITGGPCAGKTKVLGLLQEEYADQALFVPEPATMLLSGGFPVPVNEPHALAFETCIFTLHNQMHEVFQMMAAKQGKKLIIRDRGRADCAAYLKGGEKHYESFFGLTLEEAYEASDAVLHFESLATGDPEKYEKKYDNGVRRENLEEAIVAEHKTRAVWERHPDWTFITCKGGIPAKMERAREKIEELLQD